MPSMNATGQAIVDVRLVDGPLALAPVQPFPPAAGGECIFIGRTRRELHDEHGELRSLFYEAYRPMAEHVLRGLARDAIERFDCLAVRLHHAIGDVPVGEASVLVQVACGHRGEAFEACRFLIDRLKREAPIWKQERWASGGETWSPGTRPSPSGVV